MRERKASFFTNTP